MSKNEISIATNKESEKRRRRMAISQLLQSGRTDDEIFELACGPVMANGSKGLDISWDKMKKEIQFILAQWTADNDDRKPYRKIAAAKRLHQHIRKAAEDGKYTAVANLEKTLGMVEGTLEEPAGSGEAPASRWTKAAAAKIIKMDQADLLILIENQRAKFLEGKTNDSINITDTSSKPVFLTTKENQQNS